MTGLSSDRLNLLQQEALSHLQAARSAAELEQWRVTYLGRKGAVSQALRAVKDVPAEERKALGQQANQLRIKLEGSYGIKKQQLEPTKQPTTSDELGVRRAPGHLHPLTLALRRARDIFEAMGFLVVEGPDIEEARYNFDYLNIPLEHPARAETDTFYIKGHSDVVMRTHVSPLQVRGVFENKLKPPFRTMYYGPSYRAEKEDPTHGAVFQQYEFMVVEKDVTLGHLKSLVQTFYSLFFQREMEIRFRPSYFPFVEPGLEVDMRDTTTGRGQWLEMAGAGMVHPNVLKNINVDPDEYQGIALGGGLDRLAMLKYGIPDIRMMYEGNIRFLKQFS